MRYFLPDSDQAGYPDSATDTTPQKGTERLELSARKRATAFGCFTSVCYLFPQFCQGEHDWDAAAVQRPAYSFARTP